MEAESCLQEHTASRSFSCLEEIQETTSSVCCTKPCMSVAPGMTSIITHHYREHRASQAPVVLNGNSRPLSVSSQHTSSYLYRPAGEVFVHSETPDFLESFRAQKHPPTHTPTPRLSPILLTGVQWVGPLWKAVQRQQTLPTLIEYLLCARNYPKSFTR